MSNVIGFHNPDVQYGFLSNWYLSDFDDHGIHYTSMEQYMMHQKAMVFHDDEIAQQVLASSDVATIKALGRMVSGCDDRVWSGMRQIVVYHGLLEKFRQNPDLGQQLLDTGHAILAECAVRDQVWGIGLSMTDDRRFDLSQWRGQNLLGFALMYVREELKSE